MVRAPGQDSSRALRRNRGFSLVELIVVIVITGVIASVVGLFITGPIQGFLDQSRRAELVDAAQIALTRMGRDLRAALPNSVRISGNAMELLLTLDGDRYRVETPGADDDRLSFTDVAGDTAFNTFAPLSPPDPVPGIDTSYPVTGSLAIYPLQQTGANPYVVADGVMTPSGDIDITPVLNGAQTEYRISLASAGGTAPAAQPGFRSFPFDSPTRRLFLVQGPVTYLCSPPQLLRYEGYAVTAAQAVPPAVPPGTPTLIAGDVQSCAFQYDPGTSQRNAVVSVVLAMADPAVPDERIRLVRQIHIGNSP